VRGNVQSNENLVDYCAKCKVRSSAQFVNSRLRHDGRPESRDTTCGRATRCDSELGGTERTHRDTQSTTFWLFPFRAIWRIVAPEEKLIRSFLAIAYRDRGQDVAEYAIMLAVILVIVMGMVRMIGANASTVFSQVASGIQ
jgi:hypothetical protein